VLPVGGIKEKMLAAHRAGISRILLPERNEKDVVDVPEEIRDEMDIMYIRSVQDVQAMAFVDAPTDAPERERAVAGAAPLPPATTDVFRGASRRPPEGGIDGRGTRAFGGLRRALTSKPWDLGWRQPLGRFSRPRLSAAPPHPSADDEHGRDDGFFNFEHQGETGKRWARLSGSTSARPTRSSP
jgi:hypothetical protein